MIEDTEHWKPNVHCDSLFSIPVEEAEEKKGGVISLSANM